MIYKIKYQTKMNADNPYCRFTKSIFAEYSTEPTPEMVRKLVDEVCGDDFDDRNIEIEEWIECDAEEMRKSGMRVLKFP